MALESRACPEARQLHGRDIHAFLGGRIDAAPLAPGAEVEGTEAGDVDLLAAGHRTLDDVRQLDQHVFGVALGGTGVVGKGGNQLLFGHGQQSFVVRL